MQLLCHCWTPDVLCNFSFSLVYFILTRSKCFDCRRFVFSR